MVCRDITVVAAPPPNRNVIISGSGFGTSAGAFSNCSPSDAIGKEVYVGFTYSFVPTGLGIADTLDIRVQYTDYLNAKVDKTYTRVVTFGGSGTLAIGIGRNYHAGTYSNLVITATVRA